MGQLTGETIPLSATPVALNPLSSSPITIYLTLRPAPYAVRLGGTGITSTDGFRHRGQGSSPYRIPPGARLYAVEDAGYPGADLTVLRIEE